MILVDASGVSASRPGRPLFTDLDLTVSEGDRIAVVGINGCGKSTLLGVLAGTVEPESGEVRRGRGVEVAVLDQSPVLVGETLRDALHHGAPAREWEVEAVADRLGLGGALRTATSDLSGGQAKRASLARALVADAALLVLDEPTNHLDIDAIAWLEERLAAHTGGLVLVTHDRHFLDRVTTRILELDGGRGHVHEGGYASWLQARAERRDRAAAAEARRRNLARAELEWLRRGAPARTSKPKARIASATRLLAGGPEADVRADSLPLHAATPRLGDRVVELHSVGHGFGATPLFSGVDMLLDRRERLGIVGPNGSGKSTLLDIMAGRLTPREGTVEHGSTVRIAVYDQHGRELDPHQRVRDAVAGPDGVADHTHAALLDAFWFDDDAQWAPIGTLSGGERRRLQLLLTLAEHPNVLFLDEPTNDLDVDTLRQLEDFLEGFAGAVVAVSHDRAFLERVVADVVVLGGGTATKMPGGYAAYESARRASRRAGRAGVAAPEGADVAASGGANVAAPEGASGRDSAGAGSPAATGGAVAGGIAGGGGDPGGAAGTEAGGSTGASGRRSRSAGPSPSTLRHRLRGAEREVESARRRAEELRERLAGGPVAETGPGEVAGPGEVQGPAPNHEDLARWGTELAEAEEALARAEDAWLAVADEVESRGLQV